MDVREVAPAASGDEYFFSDAFRMVEQDYAPTAAACFDRAHHSGSACSQDYDIDLLHARSPLLSLRIPIRSLVLILELRLSDRWFWVVVRPLVYA